jgi:hypothetical protein
VAKEDGEADENGNEENVGRRGGQGTDEEDPSVDLESDQRQREIRGERTHCDNIMSRNQSGEGHTNNGSDAA